MSLRFRYIARIVCSCLILGMLSVGIAHAQAVARPNAIVQIYEVVPTPATSDSNPPPQPSYLASASTALRKIMDVNSPDPVFISPDEKHLAQTTNSETGGGQITITD